VDFERARSVLEAMGELIVHVGPQGHGSLVKLINNTLAAVNAAALAETLAVAQAAGLETDALREVVGASSGGSTMLNLKAGPMVERDYEPLFKLEHMLKDLRHFVAEAHRLGVASQVSEVTAGLYAQADRAGLGGQDFAAVREAVDRT
jgi:2-hydroxy-3-oxopropionate reductase